MGTEFHGDRARLVVERMGRGPAMVSSVIQHGLTDAAGFLILLTLVSIVLAT